VISELPRITRLYLVLQGVIYVIFAIAVSSASGQVLRSARAVEGLSVEFPTFDPQRIVSLHISTRSTRDHVAHHRTADGDE
jgi:hypothetical protein